MATPIRQKTEGPTSSRSESGSPLAAYPDRRSQFGRRRGPTNRRSAAARSPPGASPQTLALTEPSMTTIYIIAAIVFVLIALGHIQFRA